MRIAFTNFRKVKAEGSYKDNRNVTKFRSYVSSQNNETDMLQYYQRGYIDGPLQINIDQYSVNYSWVINRYSNDFGQYV